MRAHAFLLALCLLMVPGVSSAKPLAYYAALSTFQTKVSAMTAALGLMLLNNGGGEYGDEFINHVLDVNGYMLSIEAWDLTEDQRSTIGTIHDQWLDFADAGTLMVNEVNNGITSFTLIPRLNQLYAQAFALQGSTAEQLGEVLDAQNIALTTRR